MSFSQDVKEELSEHIGNARHCQLAELAALMHFCGQYGKYADGLYTVGFHTDNPLIVRKGFTLLKKTFNIDVDIRVNEEQMNEMQSVLGELSEPVRPTLIKSSCCQRAYLRGAFLAVGSISDPKKGYHMEFVCEREALAKQLIELMSGFGIEAKTVLRKKYNVVYLKEGESIVDVLNICEAHRSLMELENIRILKDVSNSVNRKVNCETANIKKTVNAAGRQIDDIRYIQENYGFERLPEHLREMAEIRLDNPDATLAELSGLLSGNVSKSGVNHRLRRLSEIADSQRLHSLN
ncbi:MAG: DNA-binding protein WhiA [Lachnospiraceae bacterium]|nr:DNA-binding protein WhiA [Lachnospiraceae bacterium]